MRADMRTRTNVEFLARPNALASEFAELIVRVAFPTPEPGQTPNVTERP
jgi:hypothetical protein